jgi:hypothetical protein
VVQGVARGVQAEAGEDGLLPIEGKVVFVLFVAFGEDGFFDDFKAVPAFEAAVVFTFGRFTLSFFFRRLPPLLACRLQRGSRAFPGRVLR